MALSVPSRPRLVPVVPILLGIAWGTAGASPGQDQPGGVPETEAASGEEQALRAFNEAFVEAYDRGDAPALASMYAEDAEVFEADGARYRGRSLVEQRYADLFESDPGARLELSPEETRMLSPEVAKEEGRSVVSPAEGPPVSHLYTALFVKRDGRWLLASVREEVDPLVAPGDRLRELEWMVGEWVDEGPESEARVECRWSPDGHYLLRDFSLKRAGEVVLGVSQRIAWDPIAGTFRSWEFDTEGGFGEGSWARDGDLWVVSERGVRPEGLAASSTRILERLGPDQVRWTRFDLEIDGEEVPGEERSVLTRVPPRPGLGDDPRPDPSPSAPTNSPTAPNSERNPR
ncbi:YybH family protein [Tautonia plasticadhaerens]|uniref:DUF4440 domain-containing protein n=1 Tax=Tautonia plasticadhaerens TaxID=2527974 RepID=A0A518GUS8_9BACT|nr:SgcJ/EcaC family oxidoreductase [Tautonia plasticadhaerens]QDV32331.1 hypothetical protein ElP_01590 [Tautonia plasticadhaerens]